LTRQKAIILETHFDRDIDQVWAVLADTQRLNQVAGTGFAPYVAEDVLQPDGSVIRHARKKIGPITLRWRESFGEWVEGRFCRHVRLFDNGPFEELTASFRLEPDNTGTRVICEFLARWSSPLGDILAASGLFKLMTAPVVKAIETIMAEHIAERDVSPVHSEKRLARAADDASTERRLEDVVARIEAGPYAHDLALRLRNFLVTTNPIRLKHLRPLELAEVWDVPPDHVVDLFIAAQREGLLTMRWEIMCPRCRGGKSKSLLLSDMPRAVHCESCNIDFERDFTNNVELVFSPSRWLKGLPDGDFCLMSPASTPHVKLQCDLGPGETRQEALSLPAGRYRLRTLEVGGECEVNHDGGRMGEIKVTKADVASGDPAPPGQVRMTNLDHRKRCVVIESTAWSAGALTGEKVIGMRAFRDLCPEQLLRPGDDVEIGRVAIFFSDLKGSTALYESIGDSRAFALVREHFAFLEERVSRHGGVVVKTIGDAVMAVFADGDAAMSTSMDIQGEVAAFNEGRGEEAIEIKIGLHEGSCIAITNDGSLDYFGGTVNLAARLQSEARGGEIVLSEDIAANPLARRLLKDSGVKWETGMLAGFAMPIPFARFGPN